MTPAARKLIFDAAKRRGAVFRSLADVLDMDAAIDEALGESAAIPAKGRQVSQRGINLIHSFEGCKLEAYPDPGSHDGNPWTIGWGSTGPDIKKGTVWTQQQCDERFAAELNEVYGKGVEKILGDTPTTQHQFDALVSLAYNIGLGALRGSTVMRKHKAGDYQNAARAFVMWNKNDGKVMRGLTRRRLAEADLYDDPEGGA
jgi:GH24 family phage-related lysozyme (muramidase)